MRICGLCSKKCGRWCVVRVVLEEGEASLARGVVPIGRGSLRREAAASRPLPSSQVRMVRLTR